MADRTIHVSATTMKPSLMEMSPCLPRHSRLSSEPTPSATTMVRAKSRAQASPYSSDTAKGSTSSAASISTTRPTVKITNF